MHVVVVYVHPVVGGEHYLNLAVRFLETYHAFAAGYPHESLVVFNGSEPGDQTRFVFDSMENCRFLVRDNSGFDIGAYQHASRENPCDLMVFFGASSYLKGPGWLARMVESFQKRGPTLYGVMGHRGVGGIHPHIRTTGFWIPPELFNEYPHKVTDVAQRYPFEHGRDCLTTWISKRGMVPYVVSWGGEHKWEHWDSFPNGYHRGDQSAMLAGDRMSSPPFYHTP